LPAGSIRSESNNNGIWERITAGAVGATLFGTSGLYGFSVPACTDGEPPQVGGALARACEHTQGAKDNGLDVIHANGNSSIKYGSGVTTCPDHGGVCYNKPDAQN
jgi:hypothetical protein